MPDTDGEVAVRSLGAERSDDFAEITDYCFSPEGGPGDRGGGADPLADPFGAFDGDDLVSVCAHYDFTANFRGEWTPAVGLGEVATPPERRRNGYAARLVEGSLERWRDEYPLAVLWPFSREYYADLGWATANERAMYSCPPGALASVRSPDAGRARRASVDDWRALRAVHEARAADRTLALRRADETWWRRRLGDEGASSPHVAVWERDGDVVGYLVYSFEAAGGGPADRRVAVSDLAFRDPDAYRGLLGFLADHAPQASEVAFCRESGASLLDRVADPGAVDCAIAPGPMVRVVDVTHALSVLPVDADVTADLALRVADDIASWNDGLFRLRVADGESTCTRAGGDATDAGPDRAADVDADRTAGVGPDDAAGAARTGPGTADAAVDIGTLSQLAVGYHAVDAARRLGDLSVADEATADALRAVFPPETVYLRTHF